MGFPKGTNCLQMARSTVGEIASYSLLLGITNLTAHLSAMLTNGCLRCYDCGESSNDLQGW